MPTIQIPHKLAPILDTQKRLVVLIGGRGSAKSESMGRLLLLRAQTEGADVLCGREYQNSIEDSVHKLLKTLVRELDLKGFKVTDKKIDHKPRGGFRFRGFSRNSDAVKSAQGFKYSWIEEAQTLSQKSIDDLIPTIRATGSQLFFTANPQGSTDPFSQRFIVPFLDKIKSEGFYEDDEHLIIMCNYKDNPWHGELEASRLWDYENLPRAKYDHIWEGAFNDSVDSPLIIAEWFDACIDAHLKLGFEARGVRIASHDPSDKGADPKGYAFRWGSVVLDVRENTKGDINEGGDWATSLAIQQNADAFTWDCDGMGVGLNRQIAKAFEGKRAELSQFRGSQKVDNPNEVYNPAMDTQYEKTNKDAFKNKRAQYYFNLRDRIVRTYKAINGEYHDPDTLISFDGSLKYLPVLRTELCRMPIKPNPSGLFQLYTKQEMKDVFKFKSPNLADSVMMLYDDTILQKYRDVNISFTSEWDNTKRMWG